MTTLGEAAAEASEPNWDGYGAEPMDPAARLRAEKILEAVSRYLPVPDVSSDPDGHVSMEWQLDRYGGITVSVPPTGDLAVAAVFGSMAVHGTLKVSRL